MTTPPTRHHITAFGDVHAVQAALTSVAAWADDHCETVSAIDTEIGHASEGTALADLTLTGGSSGMLRLALRGVSATRPGLHLVWRAQQDYCADSTVTVVTDGADTTRGTILAALPVAQGWWTISPTGTHLCPMSVLTALLASMLTRDAARYLWCPPPLGSEVDTHLWTRLDATAAWPAPLLLRPTPAGLAAALSHVLPSDVFAAQRTCAPVMGLLTGDGRAHAGTVTGRARAELVLLDVCGAPRSLPEYDDWTAAGAYLARHLADASWDRLTTLAAVAAASVGVTTAQPEPHSDDRIRAYRGVATVTADLLGSTDTGRGPSIPAPGGCRPDARRRMTPAGATAREQGR